MAAKILLNDELMFPSNYLSAFDLEGKDRTLTIKAVGKKELVMRGGTKKVRPVITFQEEAKEMVCNVTNGESIAFMHGRKAEAWVGKQITLFPTMVQCGRDMVDAIRVREKAPQEVDHALDDQVKAFVAKLDPDTINDTKLNDELLAEVLTMKHGSDLKTRCWNELVDFAAKFNRKFDKKAKKFVEAT